ncbi:MAG: 3-oxoadipate enol-lactonase [Pikeienuella sp.]
MEFLDTATGSLHVSVQGPANGPAIIFANSLGTDFRIWDRVLPLLPAGLRVIRYDKRGHGLSDLARGEWGMGDHVADAAAVMEWADASDGVIVGLSVGGMIAQGLAAERPDLIRGMVLCDTGAKIGSPDMWGDRIAALRADGLDAMADTVMERWFSRAFRAGRPAELAVWRNMLTRTPLEGYINVCAAIAETDLKESTARLRIPAMAMVGDEDGSTPPDLVRETAELIPGSAFHIVRGAGHLPCIEQPKATAALIGDFLAGIGHV